MVSIIEFIIIAIIVYTFMGLVAFVPYFLGFLYGILMFPIKIISQVIYPVGPLPYYVWTAWLCFIVVLTFIHLIFWKK